MRVEKYKGIYWAVYDESNALVCVTVYKKGALNLVQIIQSLLQHKEVASDV